MTRKPIAVIGSIDDTRAELKPLLRNSAAGPGAARAIGKALAEAGWPIMVYSSTPKFVESYIVEGYVGSGKAKEGSIITLFPRQRDPLVHGEFPEQSKHPGLFDVRVDVHPRWQASYYQSLPDVEGVLIIGGGNTTLIMGLMALANQKPVVSVADFGGSGEEIWAILAEKPWIDAADRLEMGRPVWSDDRAPLLVGSLQKQRENLDSLQRKKAGLEAKQQKDRDQRSRRALIYGVISAVLTLAGLFGGPDSLKQFWLPLYAICFAGIPICAGMAGAMFFTLRNVKNRSVSVTEAQAHGFWAGLGSAVLFFVSQITSNRDITSLSDAVTKGKGGLNVLLLFSLVIGFVAGLTYEAVFGKWEAVDVSHAEELNARKADS